MMVPRAYLGAGWALIVATLGAAVQAQQTKPGATFRTDTDLVEVDVRVFDRGGKFVTDLRKEDFRILEDGRPQDITNLTLFDNSSDSERGQGLDAQGTNRFYIIVLDDLHTHPLRAAAARSIARQFVEAWLSDTDRAAVVVTSGGRPYQDITSNRRALLTAIDGFRGRRVAPAPPAVTGGPGAGPGPTFALLENEERATNARSMLRTLRTLSEWLPGLDGRRKAIILISEGIDYDLAQFDDRFASAILQDSQDTAAAAIRNNVGIYAIDPRGLPTGRRGTIKPAGVADEDYFSTATVRAHQGLYALAEETGGFALLKSNDVAPVFDRIVSDNSRYYLLGYSASPATGSAKYRRIEVQVNRPDIRVRARPGYYPRARR
jgi:VWFA-related protein